MFLLICLFKMFANCCFVYQFDVRHTMLFVCVPQEGILKFNIYSKLLFVFLLLCLTYANIGILFIIANCFPLKMNILPFFNE